MFAASPLIVFASSCIFSTYSDIWSISIAIFSERLWLLVQNTVRLCAYVIATNAFLCSIPYIA